MMNQYKTHRFQIGNISCTVLADGYATYGMAGFLGRFPTIPEAEARAALCACGLDPDAQQTFYNTLLLQTAENNILVDGGERSDRHDTAGFTPDCLAAAGVAPEAIDTVVITHAHGDHVIGLFALPDNSLRYPNARYLIHPEEWAYWTDKTRQAAIAPLLKKLESKLEFIDMTQPIVAGVRPIAAYGHTVGHIGLLVESENERFVHGVDLVHTPTQFPHPDWTIKFDTHPDQARQTRLDLFNWLADEQLLTLFYHMPFPGLGTVHQVDNGFVWQPKRPS